MKIVILSPVHPLRGGIAVLSEQLAQEMQLQGYEVVIYSFSLQYPAFLFPGKTQRTNDPAPADLTIKTRLNSVHPFNWIAVGREIAREQPDQVIVRFWLPFMGPALGTVLRVLRRFSKQPVRITALVDNIIPHEKRFGDRPFAQYFVDACDDFVVMSRAVGEQIRLFTTTKPVRCSPHPVSYQYGVPMERSAARQQLNIPSDVPLVLFFGFIRVYKGLDLLLQAMAAPLLRHRAPRVHVLIAGECYDDWAFYQSIIDEHQLGEYVHLHTEFIPSDQVRVFFSAADLMVQPYRSATQSAISQVAYAFDKPMVVTNVGGLPEIVTHGVSGYVVEPDPAAIAGAIHDFFENDLAARFQEGMQAEKLRFSWSHFIDTLRSTAG